MSKAKALVVILSCTLVGFCVGARLTEWGYLRESSTPEDGQLLWFALGPLCALVGLVSWELQTEKE